MVLFQTFVKPPTNPMIADGDLIPARLFLQISIQVSNTALLD